ncbi:MAG: WD40 repeat domain-containing protein [Gammaproteobacteria bacterium]|nr:WD40 repeat domain-containing protein [Gammaproteobacteria bacterium]
MHIQNRLLRLAYSPQHQILIASDVKGRIHAFDLNLNLIQSSPVTSYTSPINALCLSDEFVFTKDRMGVVGKWNIKTLMPLDFYDGKQLCDKQFLYEDEEPSPSPNRGIAYFNGKLYTNNGYNQFVVLEADTFKILEIRQSPSEMFFDCICTDNQTLHALSDIDGQFFVGNLEKNTFPVNVRIDLGVIHGIAYDKRHDRFWTTQDVGLGDDKFLRTGVTTIEKDGSNLKQYKISHEDNEFIQFDPECRYLFVGGFNGKLYIFDNENKDFKLKSIIGPFNFQIVHAMVVSFNQIYVLLQTGELILLDHQGNELKRADFQHKCVWILEPHPSDPGLLYAGTDHGVSLIRYASDNFNNVHIEEIEKHIHGLGIIKDVKPLPDGSYIAISRKGYIFKADKSGGLIWQRQILGIPRGCAIHVGYNRCMASSDDGFVWEFNLTTGEPLDRIALEGASYACAYTEDGRRVVSTDKKQMVHVYDKDSHSILGSFQFDYRLKRLIHDRRQQKMFVTGADGMIELDLENYTQKKIFGDYMTSTKENGVYCADHVYMGGYGYQLASYRYDDAELIDLEESLPDYTKAFAAQIGQDGIPILLVGGRGGFINAYKIYDGVPHKVREFYIR